MGKSKKIEAGSTAKSNTDKSPKQVKDVQPKKEKNGVADAKKVTKKVIKGSKTSQTSSGLTGKLVTVVSILVVVISAGVFLLLSSGEYGGSNVRKITEYSASELFKHGMKILFSAGATQEEQVTADHKKAETSEGRQEANEAEPDDASSDEQVQSFDDNVESQESENRSAEEPNERGTKERNIEENSVDPVNEKEEFPIQFDAGSERPPSSDHEESEDEENEDGDDDERSDLQDVANKFHENEIASESEEDSAEPQEETTFRAESRGLKREAKMLSEIESESEEHYRDEEEVDTVDVEPEVRGSLTFEEKLALDAEAIEKIGDIKASEYYKLIGDTGKEDYEDTAHINNVLHRRYKTIEGDFEEELEGPIEYYDEGENESDEDRGKSSQTETETVAESDEKTFESKQETDSEKEFDSKVEVETEEKDDGDEPAERENLGAGEESKRDDVTDDVSDVVTDVPPSSSDKEDNTEEGTVKVELIQEDSNVVEELGSIKDEDDEGVYILHGDSEIVINKEDETEHFTEKEYDSLEEIQSEDLEQVAGTEDKLPEVAEEQQDFEISNRESKEDGGDEENESEISEEERTNIEVTKEQHDEASVIEDDEEVEIINQMLDGAEPPASETEVFEELAQVREEPLEHDKDNQVERNDASELGHSDDKEDIRLSEVEQIAKEVDLKLDEALKEMEEQVSKNAREAVNHFHAKLLANINDNLAALGKARALTAVWKSEGLTQILEDAQDTYSLVLSQAPLSRRFSYLATAEFIKLLDAKKGAEHEGLIKESLTSLLDMYPDDLEDFNNLALTLLKEGHLRIAKVAFRLLLEGDPRSSLAQLYLGYLAKISDGDFQLAVDLMLPIVERERNIQDPKIFLELGDALNKLGRKEEAKHVYAKAADGGELQSPRQHNVITAPGIVNRVWWSKEELSERNQRLFTEVENYWFNIREELTKAVEEGGERLLDPLEDANELERGGVKRLRLFIHGEKNEAACNYLPATCRMIENIPDVARCQHCEAQIYIIHAGTRLSSNISPTNARIRGDLGLSLARGDLIVVRGEQRSWKLGQFLFYDPSFDREWIVGQKEGEKEEEDDNMRIQVNNLSLTGERRAVLSLDLWHPDLDDEAKESLEDL